MKKNWDDSIYISLIIRRSEIESSQTFSTVTYKSSLVVPSEGVCSQWHLGQRMVIALQSDRIGITDVGHNLNAGTCLADAEALASQNLLVALRVKFGEALTELKLITVDVQRAISLLLALHSIRGQTLAVDAQEVTHTRLLKLQETRHTVDTNPVN